MSPGNKLAKFWQELKRRRVIKANAMYAATAFIIMEAADIMLPRLGLPDWTVTLVIVLLIVGFPVSIILSWIFDVTPEGITKTGSMEQGPDPSAAPAADPSEATAADPAPEKRGLKGSDLVIAVMFVAVCILLYPKIFKRDKFENIRQEDGRISIAVMPFQNMTNDTLWDVWQVGVQNELISNLSNSTELSVRQYQTMQEILQNTGEVNSASITPSLAGEISRKLDANTFIQGGIKTAGKAVRINAQLLDASNEEIFKTFQVEGSSEEDIFLLTDSLSALVRNYMEIRVLERNIEYDLRSGSGTSSAEAFRYYMNGLNAFFAGNHGDAIQQFKRSIAIDSGFFAAYNWLLEAYEISGFLGQDYSQIEHAKQLLDILLGWDLNQLSHLEQLTFGMIKAKYIDKNPQNYIRQCRLMLEFDAQQRIIWYNLGNAYRELGQHDKAIEAYEKSIEISKQWGIQGGWVRSYQHLADAYHNAGEHKKEAEVLEEGLVHFPGHPDLNRNHAKCAFSRGDSARGLDYFAAYKSATMERYFWSEAEVDHRRSHMYANLAYYDQAEELWRYTIEREPQSDYHKRCFAEFLILNDVNIDEGLELVNGILEDSPDYYDILFFKGLALYKKDQLEDALEILNIAWDKRLTYRHDHYLAIREVEAALANQDR